MRDELLRVPLVRSSPCLCICVDRLARHSQRHDRAECTNGFHQLLHLDKWQVAQPVVPAHEFGLVIIGLDGGFKEFRLVK